MGNKSGRTRKYVLFYLAVSCIIASLSLIACAPLQDKVAAIRAHQQLEEYRKNLAAGFFETVIVQCNQVIVKNETEPPADVALYALGEVYANQDYAGRDYTLSQYYFEKLIENFPASPLTSEAKTYISLFETIAAKEKAAAAATAAAEQKPPAVPSPGRVIENQNFEEAVQKNLQILKAAGKKKPADEALYNLGLIYAHADNPAKDYNKSQTYFQTLIKQFPDSPLAEEARIWLGLFETLEKIQQIDIEIEQQKRELIR